MTPEHKALVESARQRIENWRNNSDKARVSVPLGELRALLAAIEALSAQSAQPANSAQVTDAMVTKALSAFEKDHPHNRAAMRAALTAAIGAAPEEDTQSQWRDLALQFDGHRIQAMCLLRAIAADKAGKTEIEAFLSAPPLSGEQVLADRLTAIGAVGHAVAADIGDAVLAWMVKYDLLDGDNEYQVADVMAVMDDLVPSSALSQPHPADERVVEALRKIEYSLTKDSLCEAEKIDDALYMVRRALSIAPATADGWRANVVGWIVQNEMIPRALNSPGPVMTGPWFYPVEREQHAKDFARTLRADCLPLCVCPLPAAPTATGGR